MLSIAFSDNNSILRAISRCKHCFDMGVLQVDPCLKPEWFVPCSFCEKGIECAEQLEDRYNALKTRFKRSRKGRSVLKRTLTNVVSNRRRSK